MTHSVRHTRSGLLKTAESALGLFTTQIVTLTLPTLTLVHAAASPKEAARDSLSVPLERWGASYGCIAEQRAHGDFNAQMGQTALKQDDWQLSTAAQATWRGIRTYVQ